MIFQIQRFDLFFWIKRTSFYLLVLCFITYCLVFFKHSSLISAPEKYNQKEEYRIWETIIYNGSSYELDQIEEKIIDKIQKNPSLPFPYYLMSCMYLKKAIMSNSDLSGKGGAYLRKSMELTQNLVESYPKLDLGYISMAESLILLSHTEQALELLEQSLAVIDSPSWRIYYELSKIYMEKDLKKAFAYAQQSLGFKDSNLDIIAISMVDILTHTYPINNSTSKKNDENRKTLISKFKYFNSYYPNPYFLGKIGSLYYEQKNYKNAHYYLSKAYTQQSTTLPKAHLLEKLLDSKILYENLHNYTLATTLIKQVLASVSDTGNTYINIKSISYLYLANIELLRHKTKEASEYCSKAILQTTNSDLLLDNVINKIYTMYKDQNSLKEYVVFLSTFLDNNYLPSSAYAHLSKVYSEDLNDNKSALEHIHNAITLDYNHSEYYIQAGLIFYKMNQFDSAISMFATAEKIDPLDATAKYNQACILAITGDQPNAYKYLQKAFNINPSLYQTALKDKDLSSIIQDPKFKSMDPSNVHKNSITSNTNNDLDLDIDLDSDLNIDLDVDSSEFLNIGK